MFKFWKKKEAKVDEFIPEAKPKPPTKLKKIDRKMIAGIEMSMDNILVELTYKDERFEDRQSENTIVVDQKVLAIGTMVKNYEVGDKIRMANPFKSPEMFRDGFHGIVATKQHEIICKIN